MQTADETSTSGCESNSRRTNKTSADYYVPKAAAVTEYKRTSLLYTTRHEGEREMDGHRSGRGGYWIMGQRGRAGAL